MGDPSAKLRKRIDKAAKKGQAREAIVAQRELCQLVPRPEEWQRLAEFARSVGDVETEANARFAAYKLAGAPPAAWLELDALAARAGLAELAVDARFRAAEAYARMGDPRRAIEVCDAVLAVDAVHGAAKRIRSLMTARLERPALPELPPLLVLGKEPPASRVPAEPPPALEAVEPVGGDGAEGEFGEPGALIRQDATTPSRRSPSGEEFPLTATLRTAAMLEALRAATVDEVTRVEYVRSPQRWPSVLDWHSMLFFGPKPAFEEEINRFAQRLDVAAEEVVCEQGEVGHVLYCLDEGEVAASRVRGFFQDFGTVEQGSFFGEAGAIAGLPSTTSVTALVPCRMRVITRETIQRPTKSNAAQVAHLITTLRAFYLDLAVSICPLLAQLPPEDLEVAARSDRWTIYKPGQRIASQGEKSALQVIVVGMAKVTFTPPGGRELHLGHLTTGDVICDIDPCPVNLIAEALTFTIAVDRGIEKELSVEARAEYERRIEECRQILDDVAAAAASA
jgi:CRP-like cAMP-binding protein